MTDIFGWTRTVSESGYEISKAIPCDGQPAAGKPARYLIEIPGEGRAFDPLENSALFEEFAEAYPADGNQVVALANKYGWLFDHQVALVAPNHGGEPLRAWQREIGLLHAAVSLWEAAPRELGVWIQIRNKRVARYKGPLGFATVASETLKGAALRVLQNHIDLNLKANSCVARFQWDEIRNQPAVYWQPASLLSCLWLELALAVESKKPTDFKRCKECRRRFDTAEGKRQDSKFCREACRTKNYRERKKEARRLRDKGVSLQIIAKKLQSDPKTVKGWCEK